MAPRSTIGAFVEEHYVDLHALSDGALPDNMLAFLDMGEAGFAKAKALLDELGEDVAGKSHVYAADSIELDAPVPSSRQDHPHSLQFRQPSRGIDGLAAAGMAVP